MSDFVAKYFQSGYWVVLPPNRSHNACDAHLGVAKRRVFPPSPFLIVKLTELQRGNTIVNEETFFRAMSRSDPSHWQFWPRRLKNTFVARIVNDADVSLTVDKLFPDLAFEPPREKDERFMRANHLFRYLDTGKVLWFLVIFMCRSRQVVTHLATNRRCCETSIGSQGRTKLRRILNSGMNLRPALNCWLLGYVFWVHVRLHFRMKSDNLSRIHVLSK